MSTSPLSRGKRLTLQLAIPALGFILAIYVRIRTRSADAPEPVERSGTAAAQRVVNPAEAVADVRKSLRGGTGDAETSGAQSLGAKKIVLELGEKAVPPLRDGIYAPGEEPRVRMELIALLGKVKGAAAESLLIAIFNDPSLEERYRSTALAQLDGRTSAAIFDAVRRVYETEPNFAGRHLLLKAIGQSGQSEAVPLLTQAAQNDPSVSVRVQAVDSLHARLADSRVRDVVIGLLTRDPDENVRLAVVMALGRSGDAAHIPPLRNVVEDPASPARLRAAARNWLAKLERR